MPTFTRSIQWLLDRRHQGYAATSQRHSSCSFAPQWLVLRSSRPSGDANGRAWTRVASLHERPFNNDLRLLPPHRRHFLRTSGTLPAEPLRDESGQALTVMGRVAVRLARDAGPRFVNPWLALKRTTEVRGQCLCTAVPWSSVKTERTLLVDREPVGLHVLIPYRITAAADGGRACQTKSFRHPRWKRSQA